MTEEGKKFLVDILRAIELVEEFTQELEDFDLYEKDLKTQSATERQLAIIGESLSKLKKVDPAFAVSNERQIIAFRNRLIHAYDKIDNAIVWMVIQKHLPILKKEIIKLYND